MRSYSDQQKLGGAQKKKKEIRKVPERMRKILLKGPNRRETFASYSRANAQRNSNHIYIRR